ncbi:hypothetical protein HCI99_04775 [Listeria booriae]|uniref:Uncharacterized protein n=1 Tax=Listeria booriae TaxID=1552123 RepID=A0A7X1CB12_9LIST|nr:hypothetical protein [Listeria booriae]MBC1490953.1 hypothetical protein [Listeria booriae]MBC1491132.1 hypothetical protein [Listeria booriae]MBC6151036.1 hypothetical protein [Listeria booriae]MBC6151215.1 hypothetical protein [Listeria booriae]
MATTKQRRSIYRLHLTPKNANSKYRVPKPVKAVIQVPTDISKDDLAVALIRWKSAEPGQALLISKPSGMATYLMEDILTFDVKPYESMHNGEARLILEESECNRLLRWKPETPKNYRLSWGEN